MATAFTKSKLNAMATTLTKSKAGLVTLTLALLGAGGSRLYRNEAMHVRSFEPPSGWEQAPQTSYPRLLTSYAHPDGGRLTLTAQKVPAGTTADALARQSRPVLEKQGFAAIELTPDGSRTRLAAQLDGGKRFVRQIYIVEGGIGYVVTLAAPEARAAPMLHDFELALRSLLLGAPESDTGVSR